jgi:vancomycin resistance protein YoaR
MKKNFVFVLFLVVAFGLVLLYSFIYIYRKQALSDRILPHIYIEGIAVGGLTKKQATEKLSRLYKQRANFKIEIKFEDKTIATISAKSLEFTYPIVSSVDQAYYLGRDNNISALYQYLALNLGKESYGFQLNPIYNRQYLTNFLSELDQAYQKKPVEARFEFSDGRVTVFEPEQLGSKFKTKQALQEIEQKINQQKLKPKKILTIKMHKTILEPKTRLSNINNLGIRELVAVGSSRFAGSISERIHNIQTGAGKLNGLIIKPNEIFSFNKAIGEISSQTGYLPAFVIKSGKTVLDDGGGICQVSTTLFRAALQAGLPIVERTAHAYRVGYYEQDSDPGFDATIYSPSVDLKFKNNYSHALLIQSQIDLTVPSLSFYFYGTKDDRLVEISPTTIWNVAPPPPAEYIDDSSLPQGTTKQVDFSAWGSSTKFTYTVTHTDGKTENQEFVSNFRPWKAIFLVGKGPN